MIQECEMLINIDFGEIDGMYDPNLLKYFIDRDYWSRIVENTIYYVIGRKGTGKSALYKWIKAQSMDEGCLCSNLLFNEFQFGKLLDLKDESFLIPNQYQTICKNMILNEFVRLIILDSESLVENEEYKQLYSYYKNYIGENIEDCFRESVNRTTKINGQLNYKVSCVSAEMGEEQKYSYRDTDLRSINNHLEEIIISYFMNYPFEKKFIIQVDGIDENYTQLINEQNWKDDYFHFIICLLKATYTLNQKIHEKCDDIAKCLIYLRSDIFYEIHKIDAESARWEHNIFELNWVIKTEDGWLDNDLRKLLNARITNTFNELKGVDAFNKIINSDKINLTERRYNSKTKHEYYPMVTNIFEYIVNRTFHRPRDVVQFLIKIQKEAKDTKELNYKTIKNAEREYSLWFLSEISNEISANIPNIDSLFTMLRSLGGKSFSITQFRQKYVKYKDDIGLKADELLKYLYRLAIIYNVNDSGKVFSAIRNERSTLNPDIKICLHPGFWKGLYVSTF